jgi:hypothetical protein
MAENIRMKCHIRQAGLDKNNFQSITVCNGDAKQSKMSLELHIRSNICNKRKIDVHFYQVMYLHRKYNIALIKL